jgi:hypothetical protein
MKQQELAAIERQMQDLRQSLQAMPVGMVLTEDTSPSVQAEWARWLSGRRAEILAELADLTAQKEDLLPGVKHAFGRFEVSKELAKATHSLNVKSSD